MKNLICLTFVLFISTCAIAQNASTTDVKNASSEISFASVDEASKEMTDAAVKELSLHLQKNLRIPERVIEFGISGKSLVNINIGQNGVVKNVEVVESINSLMDKAIIKAFKNIDLVKAIALSNVTKDQTIQLPVVIK